METSKVILNLSNFGQRHQKKSWPQYMKGKEDHKLNANLGYKIHNKFLSKTKRNQKTTLKRSAVSWKTVSW